MVRRWLLVPAVVCLVLFLATPADAAWTAQVDGSAGARAGTVDQVGQPTAVRGGALNLSVTVTWPAVTAGGATVAYEVSRNGALALGTCSGTVTTTTCTDSVAIAATYTVTAVVASWSGPASPASDPV